MKQLRDVSGNYLATKAAQNGKAGNNGTIDQLAIKQGVPRLFRDVFQHKLRRDDLITVGSFGQGNMAEVPWVAVFNTAITRSAQHGYYIVLLFSADMRSCYLSLNQGVTTLSEIYGEKLAHQKLPIIAARAATYFKQLPGSRLGPISLKATRSLGKGYELGAIESFEYGIDALPSEEEFKEHFEQLLEHYDTLYTRLGKALEDISPVTEAEFQRVVAEKADKTTKQPQETLGPKQKPDKKQTRLGSPYLRDPKVAARAIQNASYRCEGNSAHGTIFTANSTKKNYVEAHHLIPMEYQDEFEFSLDVPENVVALCPNCHRLAHHAIPAEKREMLCSLIGKRGQLLLKRGISIDEERLLAMYNDLPDDQG
ncbi:MrcB family domain-containing protein [Synechococcus elongatus]|uniref:MrcB family domain-containing protein n=1 Tax=Synechococcus elongatus TaxID=32046 RepID=UPI0030D0D769